MKTVLTGYVEYFCGVIDQAMLDNESFYLGEFRVVGINYLKSDASVRSKYALNFEQTQTLIGKLKLLGCKEVFIISTCNRTELYTLGGSTEWLFETFCAFTHNSIEEFKQHAYIKFGAEATEHLFKVAAGLDSQILGDYEIVSQLKKSFQLAKSANGTGAFLERLYNTILQSSKKIKTSTSLSNGTISVAFAAIQYIKSVWGKQKIASSNVLIIGAGKIGRNCVKNVQDYLSPAYLTIINRNYEKALAVSEGSSSAIVLHWSNLYHASVEADIIIVATGATQPILHPQHINKNKSVIVIDLSIPSNVAAEVKELPNVLLSGVDEISSIKDETLQRRKADVPVAEKIIQQHLNDFILWCENRKHAILLKKVKSQLQKISESYDEDLISSEDSIQKIVNLTAFKLKNEKHKGCIYLEALNSFITISEN